MSIEVNSLLKKYGSQTAVDHISFTVGKGEIVGFLGPNGAGKSTTMKMITGSLDPDGGDVRVCGIPVRETPLETKARIGYLPEANPLYHDMYVREYLAFMAGIHQVSAASDRISEVIRLTGLLPESHKKIGQLSKGYKQRVGLAAALIHDPEVLILDEPTTGLDPNQIVEIREVIRTLGLNKTVLFSSHILQEVEGLFNRWNAALQTGDPEKVAALYAPNAVLLATVSNTPRNTHALIVDYFEHFLKLKPNGVVMRSFVIIPTTKFATHSGVYKFDVTRETGPDVINARFTFEYQKIHGKWMIVEHHSSAMPEADIPTQTMVSAQCCW